MSLDPTTTRTTLYVVDPTNGVLVQLPPTALTWEEQSGELAVRLQATIPEIQLAPGWLSQLCALGGIVYLYADQGQGPQEVFHGKIFDWDWKDDGPPAFSIIAYDNLVALQMSEDDRTYLSFLGTGSSSIQSLTAGDILQDISNVWSLDILGCSNLTTLMPQLIFTGAKLSQMAMQILDQTYWFGGGVWVLRSALGVITVQAPALNQPLYLLTNDVLEHYEDKQSIMTLVTRINVMGLGDVTAHDPVSIAQPRMPSFETLDGHTEFGVFSAIFRLNMTYGAENIDRMARAAIGNRGQPSRIQTFIAPDLPFLRRSDAIAVEAGTLRGTYIITGISHDAGTKKMTISIDTSGDLSDANVNFTIVDTAAASGAINPYLVQPPSPLVATGQVNPYRYPLGRTE